MRKNTLLIVCMVLLLTVLTACGSDSENVISQVREEYANTKSLKALNPESITIKKLISETKGPVNLTVWTSDEDKALTQTIADAFEESFPDLDITIRIGQEAEPQVRDSVLEDVKAAADVYCFVDDQLDALVAGGALEPVDEHYLFNPVEANVPSSIEAASIDGVLYGYPMTADNGYFMYYDKSVFSQEDVKCLNDMVAVAQKHNKMIAMHLSNGWYLYSFFRATGCILKQDGDKNSCDWDTDKGVTAAEMISELCRTGVFVNMDDTTMTEALREGKIAAMVNSTWRASDVKDALGDHYGVCALPYFTKDGRTFQLASFSGYKLLGVNPYSENIEWAKLLAEYMTSQENQVRRFEARRLGPSNKIAQTSSSVLSDPTMAALSMQSIHADPQRVADCYWDAAAQLGQKLSEGPDKSEIPKILEEAVKGIRGKGAN